MALALEAARVVDEGIADAEDVNKACVLAFNQAMGPLSRHPDVAEIAVVARPRPGPARDS